MATAFPSLRLPPRRVPRALLLALGASVLLHAAWSLWPVNLDDGAEPPLTVTLEAMPAPPVPLAQPAAPAVPPAHPARRVPRRHAQVPRAPASASSPTLVTAPSVAAVPEAGDDAAHVLAQGASQDGTAPAADTTASTTDATAAIGPPVATPAAPQLPPRLDLAYKVFLGTQGFLIGDATYRFEHDGNDYRISTVAQARGLAALIVHGRGLIESRGEITPAGLKPAQFAVERGDPDKREVATFDWQANVITLHDHTTQPLSPLTFDPLTVLWQTYFTPPDADVYRFSVATTRKVYHYTVTREAEERLAWRGGQIDTVRWHRVNNDNHTEAWFWLAPSMHQIPVKIRVTATHRGTLEAVLDAIRTDATPDAAAHEAPLEARTVTRTDPFAAHGQ